jgi:type IV pilus assembly protein PilC
MPKFKYQARNADGKRLNGTIVAQNENDAVGELRKQQLTVLSVKPESTTGGFFSLKIGGKKAPRARVRSDDLVVFTRQLATMISAGIPLLESLEILAEQVDDKGFQFVLGDIVDSVRSGTDFSAALALHPRIFEKIYVNMIRAARRPVSWTRS